jgi:hypothetical protein
MIVGQLGYLAGPLVSDRRSLPQASGFDLFPLRENAFLLALPEIVWARNRLLPFLAFDEEVTNPPSILRRGRLEHVSRWPAPIP